MDSLWHEIVDSLTDAVIVLAPGFEPLAVNAAAETMLAAPRVSRGTMQRLMRNNDWLKGMVETCLTSGQSLDNPETTLNLEANSLTVRAAVSPLITAAGVANGVVILLHDYSQRPHPSGAFDDDTLKLSSAGLAHEIKNPLTGIKGAAELLLGMVPGDARANQYGELILDGVNRIAGLVEQVLTASNPQRLKRTPVNVHQLLHQALGMTGLLVEGTPGEIAIQQDFDPSLPDLYGDASALERVFINLLRNARDAVETLPGPSSAPSPPAVVPEGTAQSPNPPTIRLHTAIETQFRLSTQGKRRQFLRVEISDNGHGMSPAELKQLFTPFFTTKPSGTGLGLVLSQRMVAMHGGKLWAERGFIGGRRRHPLGAPATARPRPREALAAHSGFTAIAAKATAEADSPVRGMTFCVMLPVGPE